MRPHRLEQAATLVNARRMCELVVPALTVCASWSCLHRPLWLWLWVQVRGIAGDLVEEVKLIDNFTHPKTVSHGQVIGVSAS